MARTTVSQATKVDRNRQVIEVDPKQDAALMVLLRGGSDQEAAEASGVSRQTVNGWVNCDGPFVAELNRRRQALWAFHQDQLRSMIGAALTVLREDLASTDPSVRRQAALQVLKSCGLSAGDLIPAGPTDPERVQLNWANEKPGSLSWMATDF